MTVSKALKPLSAAISAVVLSACTIPGMHMEDRNDFTPALARDDTVSKAALIPITPELILKQRRKRVKEERQRAENYTKPRGFTADEDQYTYTIGKHDVVSIIVWDYQSLTSPMTNMVSTQNMKSSGFTVNAEGEIFYPYVGYVKIAGLTVPEARDLIAKRLSKYLKEPQVTLQVIKFSSQKIHVNGAVRQPTVLPITNVPTTVLDAINAAGGIIRCGNELASAGGGGGGGQQSMCADTQNVIVKEGGQKTTVDIDQLKAPDGSSRNWVLEEDTRIMVPNNRYLVYAVGSVNQQGAYNMINGEMSLTDAIVAAGGVTEGSDPSYTYVIRNYTEQPRVFSINMYSPDAMILAGEFELKPGDIVFVSPSTLQNVGQVLRYVSPLTSLAISTASLGVSVSSTLGN